MNQLRQAVGRGPIWMDSLRIGLIAWRATTALKPGVEVTREVQLWMADEGIDEAFELVGLNDAYYRDGPGTIFIGDSENHRIRVLRR